MILQAQLVISEAMHAAIIADSMRVNWVPVVASHNINTFKWLDWLSMLDITYQPLYIGHPDYIQEQINRIEIKSHTALYKPNYLELTLDELLNINKCSFLARRLYKFRKKILHLKKRTVHLKNKNIQREEAVALLLKKAISSPSYMSSDILFRRNLNLLEEKLNELKNNDI